jgi:hypothetical protein
MPSLKKLLNQSLDPKSAIQIYEDVIQIVVARKHEAGDRSAFGAEDVAPLLRDYWEKQLKGKVIVGKKLQAAKDLLENYRHQPTDFLVLGYQEACQEHLRFLRQKIISNHVKKLTLEEYLESGASVGLEGLNGKKVTVTQLRKNFKARIATLSDQEQDDLIDELNVSETNLWVRKYRTVQRMNSALAVEGDALFKIGEFNAIYQQNKLLLARGNDSGFNNFIDKLGMYTAVFVAGLFSFGYAGVKLYQFFSQNNQTLDLAKMGDKIEHHQHRLNYEYTTVRGVFWEVLDRKERWFKRFTGKDAEDILSRLCETYDEAKNQMTRTDAIGLQLKDYIKEMMIKDLAREHLDLPERYKKFIKAVKNWQPEVSASEAEREKAMIVKGVILDTLSLSKPSEVAVKKKSKL